MLQATQKATVWLLEADKTQIYHYQHVTQCLNQEQAFYTHKIGVN